MAAVGIVVEAPLDELPSNWALTTLPTEVIVFPFRMAAQYKVPPFESPRPTVSLIRRTESVIFVPVAFTTLILETEGTIDNEEEPVG